MINLKSINWQSIIAYVSLIMGVLTSQVSSIHLPPVASALLGIFGIVLHPQTSIMAKPTSSEPPKA